MTLLAAALLLAPSSNTPPIVLRHDRAEAASVALARRFGATVRCEPDGCGTLIGKRWVLTAAHVAMGFSPFSPRVEVGGQLRRVRQVIFHPDSASRGHAPPRVDLALVELEDEVRGVEPVPLYRAKGELGQEVVVVGYGDYGPANQQPKRMNGVRRAATNVVEEARDGRLHLRFDEPPAGTELEGVGGPGDSGGPLYFENDEGLHLVGVSSASMGGRPGSYGTIDIYARVSTYAKWIDASIAEAKGKPAQRPEILELGDGFPDGPRGELIDAFLGSFAIGERAAFEEFGETWRSVDSKERNPLAAFVRRMLRLRLENGLLEPTHLAKVSDARWVVLCRSEMQGWQAVSFRFAGSDEELALDDLGIRADAEPDPDPANKSKQGD